MVRFMNTAPWHTDSNFSGKFHPNHPNDIQVVVHDGEPRRTQRPPEACWVTLTGVHGALRVPVAGPDAKPPLQASQVRWEERTVYTGKLLNVPKNLQTVRQGDTILVVYSPGLPCPLHVTPNYLAERPRWSVTPCNKCGADQTLDPMTIMAKTRFPDAPAGMTPVAFSAFCGCGGTMMLAMVEGAPMPAQNAPGIDENAVSKKPWWKFW